MPNYKKHADTGALVGVAAGTLINLISQYKKINSGEQRKVDFSQLAISGIGGMAIGTFGGILPDLLEPAKNPHHRNFFHSIFTATAISYGLYKLNSKSNNLDVIIKGSITTAGIGYLSHLKLDSKTPFGLPLI